MKNLKTKRIKKSLLIVFFAVQTIFIQAQSDTTYTGNITVTTQAQVDALGNTLAGKTRINGNLTIGYTLLMDSLNSSNITNLTPLSNIVHITGGVQIQQNGQLVNFTGLGSLQSIGGDFYVNANDTLTALGDFTVLDSIGGDFSVFNNDQLTTLGNFPELQTIGESLGESFLINRNGKLTDLGDFSALQTIGGYFEVSSNDTLTTLGDFSALQTIGGYFEVSSNDTLTTLGDFSALQTIGGDFSVFFNDQLTTLGNFSALQTIGGDFSVFFNDQLTTLGNFSALQTIGEYFRASSNNQLTTLGDFPALQTIGGYFNVFLNDQLLTLGDFTALQTIGGYFSVFNNDQLTTLGDFSALQTIGGVFIASSNNQLTTLGDFPELQSIGEYFRASFNNQLTTLGDFPELQSIGEYFMVIGNFQLLTLGNFPNLMSIGVGSVNIPISSLGETKDSVSIVVEENPNLVLCSWVEDFLPTETHAVTGDIYINYNATGCNGTEEIDNPVLLAKSRIFSHKDSTTTSFNIYANIRWQLVKSDDATWITSLSSDSSTHSSRITGENEATITLMHTRDPNETPRSTTLTLTAIDENGDELTNPEIITINFTQLPTVYKGNITLRSQEEVDEFISNTTVIDGNLTIGYTDFGDSRSDITDLTPLSNITDIIGNLSIQQNGQLDNINDLNNLQTIGGYFEVYGNDTLTTIGDFSSLQTIGGNFSVGSNDILTTLGDFPALDSIGRYFSVSSNDRLTTLGDFTALQTIGEYFSVSNNDTLTTLGDFPALDSIGRYFSVSSNDRLTTLGDFTALQTIGEYFRVISNDTLTTIGNFSNLISIGVRNGIYIPSLDERRDTVSIVVENNSSLSDCYTLAEFLPGGATAVSGEIYINNNAVGCNSEGEIIAAPHTIMLTSHTEGDSVAIAYDEVVAQTIMFSIGGGATGWTSAITYTPASANFITLDTNMNDNQTGAVTLMATPTINTGVERTATITLATTGMGTPDSVSLTITQGAMADTTTLPPKDTTTTLSTHTKESLFTLYPNPTKGTLTIEGVTGYLQMYVHDLVGREVMTYSLTPSKKTIDVSSLPSGMYVVTVQGEDKTWTEVLIIDNG